jgi:hypothetical protein
LTCYRRARLGSGATCSSRKTPYFFGPFENLTLCFSGRSSMTSRTLCIRTDDMIRYSFIQLLTGGALDCCLDVFAEYTTNNTTYSANRSVSKDGRTVQCLRTRISV